MNDASDPSHSEGVDDHSSYSDGTTSALAGFADTTELALMMIDARGIITYVNKAGQRLLGYERDEMVGCTLDLIIPERLRGAHSAGVARVGGGQPSKLSGKTVEVAALRRDGTEFPIELSLSVWQGPDGVVMGGIIRDISERRQRDTRLHRLAHHDPLTGLPNRAQVNERLGAILAAGGQAAILLFDLDGFKKVNDNLGHATGDTLLQALAVRLPAVLDADAIPARIGGDEFAVILPDVGDPMKASAAARSILDAFRQSFTIGDHVLKLGACVGVALGPAHGADPEELIASADLALSHARRDGSPGFRLYEPAMRSAIAARRLMKDELLQAVSAGELVLHYQPQIDLESGAVFGAEALLRWNHPTRGLLFPATFLSVLESHSLALQVGCWILDEACRQAAEWRSTGLPEMRIAANLFSAQVNAGNLAQVVTETLDRHGLPPEALEIEVTETVVLENDDRVLAPFRELRDRQVGVAFDDFGTGHASLSTLKRFPLTTLKIDRSFVRDLLVDRSAGAIVQALLGMGRSMGLDVIAEGVETEEQQAVLLAMGCRIAQGYLYAKALPAEAFTRRFVETKGKARGKAAGSR
ncbi:EAL domain-containing protein [Mesorhizobium sp. DCY119]|jgi:diguanylate cyclase (GGDEF)-like protein/PAS domain S-box-containing protein|uniref:putative bifunctional diguanylate cyclase/phosphodiesterase n=1 Tax=Mesorhizobium sp. DCY119 TaxID=2108445 RepID=UPI000E6D2463|nr:EAL domain-containing protein [Mesorhizobium sp. DCY119]RJG43387.1 EAL domain-containing protein [Mesorhizobium sp. DCY119]